MILTPKYGRKNLQKGMLGLLQMSGIAGVTGGAVAELNDLPAAIASIVTVGGAFPICSYRMHSNGQGQTATGDTGAALIYAQFGNDWLISGLNSEFECQYIQTGTSGAAGTLSGSLATFNVLTSIRGLSWQKDTNLAGNAIWQGTVEIREIAVPASTTGALAIQMTSSATP